MQIHKFGKNITNANGAGDAAGNAVTRAKQKEQAESQGRGDRNKPVEESFQESLQKSMHMERAEHLKRTGHMESGVGTENREEMEKESRTVNGNVKAGAEKGWYADIAGRGGSVVSHAEQGIGKAEGCVSGAGRTGERPAVKEVEVRRISYGECDKVEINVLEGYTLKAKLEGGPGGGIYVEMKDEEGRFSACLFEGAGLQRDSRSAMERIAYAVVHDGEEI